MHPRLFFRPAPAPTLSYFTSSATKIRDLARLERERGVAHGELHHPDLARGTSGEGTEGSLVQ